MTVPRTSRPRGWSTAAAAAFVAGLATTGATFARSASAEIDQSASAEIDQSASAEAGRPTPPVVTMSGADATPTVLGARSADVIALRPDPANPDQLVVDFGGIRP